MATRSQMKNKERRREEVIRLRKEGLSNIEIAKRLKTTERVVATLFYRARQEGYDVPKAPYDADRRSARS